MHPILLCMCACTYARSKYRGGDYVGQQPWYSSTFLWFSCAAAMRMGLCSRPESQSRVSDG